MKKSMLFFIIICVSMQIFGIIDKGMINLFKISEEKDKYILYIHSDADPEIIQVDNNTTLLFRNRKLATSDPSVAIPHDETIRRLTMKNYQGKGAGINIFSNAFVSLSTKRISPDVVTVSIPYLKRKTVKRVAADKRHQQRKIKRKKKVQRDANLRKIQKNEAKKKVAFATAKEINKSPEKTKKAPLVQKQKEVSTRKDEEKSAFEQKLEKELGAGEENNNESDLMGLLDVNNEKSSVSSSGVRLYLAVGFFVLAALGFLYMKKKEKKNMFPQSKLMHVVETLPLGIKEKLVLLDVAGNYVLLFMRDKDVKELTTFKGDAAVNINSLLANKDNSTDLDHELNTATQSKKKSEIRPFKSRLEQILQSEQTSREDDEDIEEKVFSTINKLKRLKTR